MDEGKYLSACEERKYQEEREAIVGQYEQEITKLRVEIERLQIENAMQKEALQEKPVGQLASELIQIRMELARGKVMAVDTIKGEKSNENTFDTVLPRTSRPERDSYDPGGYHPDSTIRRKLAEPPGLPVGLYVYTHSNRCLRLACRDRLCYTSPHCQPKDRKTELDTADCHRCTPDCGDCSVCTKIREYESGIYKRGYHSGI